LLILAAEERLAVAILYIVIARDSVGRDWAPVQRWGIALDDGRQIFANDEDLTPAE